MTLPDLARYDRFTVDCETTGLTYADRPVGLAIATPGPSSTFVDGERWYLRWGHKGGGNNCTLAEMKDWSKVELTRPDQLKINHHLPFDLRMMAYDGIAGLDVDPWALGPIACTQVAANLLYDIEPRGMSLDALGKRYAGVGKTGDDELYVYLASLFGGMKTRKAQMPNLHRAPGDGLVETYAIGDAVGTGLLHDARIGDLRDDARLWRLYDEVEMALMPILLKMHLVGVRINRPAASELINRFEEQLEEVQAWWRDAYGVEVVTGMEKAIVAPLFDAAGLELPRTKTGQPQMTKELLEAIDHPLANNLVLVRHLKKMADTFVNNYVIKHADDQDLIHAIFHQVVIEWFGKKKGALGGRFSSSDPNMQNIPARDEEIAPLIRGLFVPYTSDHDWAKIDYSQIEYRYLAHYAATLGYPELAERYQNEPDVDFHQMCMDLTGLPRPYAKNVNFATVYGAGDDKVAAMLGVDLAEGSRIRAEYNRKLPAVRQTYERAESRANARGYIRTWGGRKAHFKRRGRRGYQDSWKALNRLLQGSAADLMKESMVAVAGEHGVIDWDTMILHLTVHDELDFSKDRGAVGDKMAREVLAVMQDFDMTRDAVDPEMPRVPIMADYELGKDWGHTEKMMKEAA